MIDAHDVYKNDFNGRVCRLTDSLAETLIKKNKDYGDSHAKLTEELGETVILIRLKDKLNRLTHLIQSGSPAQVNESIEDTLLDLAGYSVLELERRRRDSGTIQVEALKKEYEELTLKAYEENKRVCDHCGKELGDSCVVSTLIGGKYCSVRCRNNDVELKYVRK